MGHLKSVDLKRSYVGNDESQIDPQLSYPPTIRVNRKFLNIKFEPPTLPRFIWKVKKKSDGLNGEGGGGKKLEVNSLA